MIKESMRQAIFMKVAETDPAMVEKIREYIKNTPELKDSDFHAFMDVNAIPHEVGEAIVYAFAHEMANKQASAIKSTIKTAIEIGAKARVIVKLAAQPGLAFTPPAAKMPRNEPTFIGQGSSKPNFNPPKAQAPIAPTNTVNMAGGLPSSAAAPKIQSGTPQLQQPDTSKPQSLAPQAPKAPISGVGQHIPQGMSTQGALGATAAGFKPQRFAPIQGTNGRLMGSREPTLVTGIRG